MLCLELGPPKVILRHFSKESFRKRTQEMLLFKALPEWLKKLSVHVESGVTPHQFAASLKKALFRMSSKQTKTTYFKFMWPGMGSKMRMVIGSSWNPEQLLMHVRGVKADGAPDKNKGSSGIGWAQETQHGYCQWCLLQGKVWSQELEKENERGRRKPQSCSSGRN